MKYFPYTDLIVVVFWCFGFFPSQFKSTINWLNQLYCYNFFLKCHLLLMGERSCRNTIGLYNSNRRWGTIHSQTVWHTTQASKNISLNISTSSTFILHFFALRRSFYLFTISFLPQKKLFLALWIRDTFPASLCLSWTCNLIACFLPSLHFLISPFLE